MSIKRRIAAATLTCAALASTAGAAPQAQAFEIPPALLEAIGLPPEAVQGIDLARMAMADCNTVSFATQALGIQTETQYRLKLNELFRLTAGPNANIQQRATALMTQQEWVNNAVKCGAVTAEPLAVFNTVPALLSS